MTELTRSPLYERELAAGAKFAEFGGWSMPLEFSGVVAEHNAVRQGVGVFDVSHLGKARVIGRSADGETAKDFLNRCFTNDLDRIGPGKAQYTLLCNESGGVVDDLICYLADEQDVLLIPNAANAAEVIAILTAAAPEGITIVDQHHDFAVIAVQGPDSVAVLQAAGWPTELDYMSFTAVDDATVCRTGYTGEVGYELVVPSDRAGQVWDDLLAAGEPYGIRPAGLGARDTLRTEMGYSLHGQEITPGISPVQARLGWAVAWRKPEFFGHQALRAEKEQRPVRTSCALVAQGRGIPRPGMDVLAEDGTTIGTITSGTFSPTLKKGIGLALVERSHAGDAVMGVQVRNRVESFDVRKPPLVETGTA